MNNIGMETPLSNGSVIKLESPDDIINIILNLIYSTPIDDSSNIREKINRLVADNKMSFGELFKLNNLNNITKKTKIYINGNNNQVNKIVAGDYYDINVSYVIDWSIRFYDSAGSTSDDILQDLWSKILADEMKHPASCSLRTLDKVRNMTSYEAKAFEKLCKYVIITNNDYFVFDTGFSSNTNDNNICREYIINAELNFEKDILPLIECGLIATDRTLAVDHSDEYELNVIPFNCDNILFVLDMNNENLLSTDQFQSHKVLFNEDAYFLTSSGIELYKAIKNTCGIETGYGYIIACFLYYKMKYNIKKAGIHYINNGLTSNNLLELAEEQVKKQFGITGCKNDILIRIIENFINKYKE